MDVGANQKESYFTLEWTIKNFICWKIELHGEFIKCISRKIPHLEIILYPKGINGTEDRLKVMIINRRQRDRPVLFGEVSLLLSDRRTQIDIKKFNFPRENDFVVLSGWPKNHSVVDRVSKKDGAIVLRFRTRAATTVAECIRTTIYVLDKYFALTADHLQGLSPKAKKFVTFEWNLDDGSEESMDLRGVIPPEDRSKICLLLVPTRLRKCVFAMARGPSKSVKEHMFNQVSQKWRVVCLVKKEVDKKQFLSILCVRIVPVKSPEHEYLPDLPENTDDTNKRQTNPSTNPNESNRPNGAMAACASGWSGSSNGIEDTLGTESLGQLEGQGHAEGGSNVFHPQSPSFSVQRANQIMSNQVFLDFWEYCLSYPSKDNLTNLYSEVLRHRGLTDIVQPLARYLACWNMCDALVIAMDLRDSNLLREVHRFFVANKHQVLLSAHWSHLRDSNPLLALMFLTKFDQQ